MSRYAEQLRDPRWQKMRLRVMDRDDFTCQECGSNRRELHVHHKLYRKGAAPWEYDPAELVTLCFRCHDSEHAEKPPPDNRPAWERNRSLMMLAAILREGAFTLDPIPDYVTELLDGEDLLNLPSELPRIPVGMRPIEIAEECLKGLELASMKRRIRELRDKLNSADLSEGEVARLNRELLDATRALTTFTEPETR